MLVEEMNMVEAIPQAYVSSIGKGGYQRRRIMRTLTPISRHTEI